MSTFCNFMYLFKTDKRLLLKQIKCAVPSSVLKNNKIAKYAYFFLCVKTTRKQHEWVFPYLHTLKESFSRGGWAHGTSRDFHVQTLHGLRLLSMTREPEPPAPSLRHFSPVLPLHQKPCFKEQFNPKRSRLCALCFFCNTFFSEPVCPFLWKAYTFNNLHICPH